MADQEALVIQLVRITYKLQKIKKRGGKLEYNFILFFPPENIIILALTLNPLF